MSSRVVYLDYAATTPVDPRVAEKMSQCLTLDGVFGNSSSVHVFGLAAKEMIEKARAQVAGLLGAEASEIIWTSGATEATNLALKGAAKLYQKKGKHIITVKTEHPSVLDCCQQLEKEGYQVTYLSPDKNGVIDLVKIKNAIRDDTMLISVMHVNNEIGVIQDIAAIGKMCSDLGVLFHVDAAQSAGKVAIDVNTMHVDLMSVCAHKVYGPKGVGALYIRKQPRVRVAAQMHGGGQESGMRSGTLATHQIVGMGEAFFLAQQEMNTDNKKLVILRDVFLQGIASSKNMSVNNDVSCSVPGIINLCVTGVKSREIMNALPHLAISSGSACGEKGSEPSYVLRALGLSVDVAQCSVRFSMGRFTTQSDIELALQYLHALN